MAEEVPQEESKVATKTDSDIASWIRNLAALIGVFGALAGIYVSVQGLKAKADADAAAAVTNQKTEETKLAIAQLQLQSQDRNNEQQRLMHAKDLEMEMLKHKIDIDQQEKAAASQNARTDSERLGTIITRMFANNSGSEGDLAILFNHVGRDTESEEIIENAVLARLENPRSVEEIDLGFRLLERIGIKAIDVTAQANRSARQKYDAIASDLYISQISASNIATVPEIHAYQNVDKWEDAVARQLTLDRSYVYATINKRLQSGVYDNFQKQPKKASDQLPRLDLVTAVIERSNLALQSQLERSTGPVTGLNWSNTYLTGSIISPAIWLSDGKFMTHPRIERIEMDGAYIGIENFSQSHPTDNVEVSIRGRFYHVMSSDNQAGSPNGCKFRRLGEVLSW